MAFADYEGTVEDANPIELFEISVGTEVFYFTNTQEGDLTFGLNTYLSEVLDRGQHKVDKNQPGSELELSLATNSPNAQALTSRWVSAAPEVSSTQLRVYKVHRNDPAQELYPFWFGSIASVDYSQDGRETLLLFRSLSDLFTLQGPRVNWGSLCNHQLFDSKCTLNRVDFQITTTVASIAVDGVSYTLASVPAPSVRYEGGELKKQNQADSRLVVNQVGAVITVQYPIPSIQVGDTVELIEGCQHNLADCAAFSNDINFGGSPYTPTVNPFTKGLESI